MKFATYEIIVISLSSAKDRREQIYKKLEALNLPFRFFNAFDGRKISDKEMQEWQTSHGSKVAFFDKGGLACSKSHYDVAYNWFQRNSSKYLIILEDDADINDDFKKFCAEIKELENIPFAVLRIGGRYQKNPRVALILDNEKRIFFPLEPSFNLCGYVINRDFGDVFLKHIQRFDAPTDVKITKDIIFGLPICEMSPFLFQETGAQSTLDQVNMEIAKKVTSSNVNSDHVFLKKIKKIGRRIWNDMRNTRYTFISLLNFFFILKKLPKFTKIR